MKTYLPREPLINAFKAKIKTGNSKIKSSGRTPETTSMLRKSLSDTKVRVGEIIL